MKRRSRRPFAALLAAVGLLAIVLFPSCAGSRPQPDARANAQLQAPPVTVQTDTNQHEILQKLVLNAPRKTLIQKLNPFYKPETQKIAGAETHTNATQIPRKCKGCQFVIQNGNGNTSTQSNTEKKGTSATGDGAKVAVAGKNSTQATDSAQALNTGGGAAATGAGAHAEGGAVKPEAPGFWATLAEPLGYVACAAGVAGVGYLLYLIWGFLPLRKNNQA